MISAAESEQLLRALEPKRPQNRWHWLFLPVAKLNVYLALGLGLVAILVGLWAGEHNIRFDGVLDLHIAQENAELWVRLAEQLLAWPGLALGLWLYIGIRQEAERFRLERARLTGAS